MTTYICNVSRRVVETECFALRIPGMGFILANKAVILGAIVALDTLLAQIPQVKANSTFQLISGLVSKAAGYFGPSEE